MLFLTSYLFIHSFIYFKKFSINSLYFVYQASNSAFLFPQTDALDDRKTTIYNLQRRVKWSKQQMESKDLHLGLLKKKVAELEDLLREKGRVEVERDENSLRYKKLVKHNDKLQRELLNYKQQVTKLKAKLLEASELRVSLLN